jgi:hypothetical protein
MLCYYFSLIIPVNVKIVNTRILQMHKIPYITTLFYTLFTLHYIQY